MSSTTGISPAVLTEQLASATADVERISSSFKVDEKGRFTISTDQHEDYKKAVSKAKEIKSVLDGVNTTADLRSFLDAPEGSSVAARDAGHYGGNIEGKSLADVLIDSPEFKSLQGEDFRNLRSARGEMEGKSIFSLSAGTIQHQALGTGGDLGFIERHQRQWHIRDLFPKTTTKNAFLYGVRETGFVNNAAQVSERVANAWVRAPKSQLTLAPILYPVAEIAHTIDAHKNILSDEPRLRTFINQRMLDGIKFKEDRDLLYSVGGGDKLTGLFNVEGVQQYKGVATDKYSIQIRRAITKAKLAEYDPTGIVISPEMWEDVEIETDNTGAFRVALAVAVGAEKKVWRLNVVETTAMSDANFLIGSFGLGAQLHDRESVSVTVSSENATNFEEGVVTIRADERVALEVPRPESFVVGTWTTPTV